MFGREEWVERDAVRILWPGGPLLFILSHTAKEVQLMRNGWHTFEVAVDWQRDKLYGRRTKRLNLTSAATMNKVTIKIKKRYADAPTTDS